MTHLALEVHRAIQNFSAKRIEVRDWRMGSLVSPRCLSPMVHIFTGFLSCNVDQEVKGGKDLPDHQGRVRNLAYVAVLCVWFITSA